MAELHGFRIMEWTLDQECFAENPLMTEAGRSEIQSLMRRHGVAVPSLTGDCFMQAPFYKAAGPERECLLQVLEQIIRACALLEIKTVLIPLVDDGRLENETQAEDLLRGLENIVPVLEETGLVISFESDFPPKELAGFLCRLDSRYFGVTYDIGNSAALGFQPLEEIAAYGTRIINVHVKDRILGGSTVPLGEGDADIPAVLRLLLSSGYRGNFILQTARAEDGDHAGTLCRYRDMVFELLRG